MGAWNGREHRGLNTHEYMVQMQTRCSAQFVGVSTRLGRRGLCDLRAGQFEGPLKGLGRDPLTSACASKTSSKPGTATLEDRSTTTRNGCSVRGASRAQCRAPLRLQNAWPPFVDVLLTVQWLVAMEKRDASMEWLTTLALLVLGRP